MRRHAHGAHAGRVGNCAGWIGSGWPYDRISGLYQGEIGVLRAWRFRQCHHAACRLRRGRGRPGPGSGGAGHASGCQRCAWVQLPGQPQTAGEANTRSKSAQGSQGLQQAMCPQRSRLCGKDGKSFICNHMLHWISDLLPMTWIPVIGCIMVLTREFLSCGYCKTLDRWPKHRQHMLMGCPNRPAKLQVLNKLL